MLNSEEYITNLKSKFELTTATGIQPYLTCLKNEIDKANDQLNENFELTKETLIGDSFDFEVTLDIQGNSRINIFFLSKYSCYLQSQCLISYRYNNEVDKWVFIVDHKISNTGKAHFNNEILKENLEAFNQISKITELMFNNIKIKQAESFSDTCANLNSLIYALEDEVRTCDNLLTEISHSDNYDIITRFLKHDFTVQDIISEVEQLEGKTKRVVIYNLRNGYLYLNSKELYVLYSKGKVSRKIFYIDGEVAKKSKVTELLKNVVYVNNEVIQFTRDIHKILLPVLKITSGGRRQCNINLVAPVIRTKLNISNF
jgi:hypothetical protein